MEKNILDLNEIPQSDSGTPESIEDIIARGAATALESEPVTEPEAGSEIEITEPRRRRAYRRRGKKELTAEEQQAEQAAADLDAFFSPDGIGAVFTNGLNAFYLSCGAAPLTEQEQPMLARVFAQWARYRLPARASAYQPDILLVATVSMATLPRLKPIAEKTAPWWRRLFAKLRRKKLPNV